MIRFTADKARTRAQLGSNSAETKSLSMLPELREQIVARIQIEADNGGTSLEDGFSGLELNGIQQRILEGELREAGFWIYETAGCTDAFYPGYHMISWDEREPNGCPIGNPFRWLASLFCRGKHETT